MQKFVERMITERDDLKGKISKARKAIEAPPFGTDKTDIELLSMQVEAMDTYMFWLEKRINRELDK